MKVKQAGTVTVGQELSPTVRVDSFKVIHKGKEYIRSPGHTPHDVDYFHHYDRRRSSIGAEHEYERNSPDTTTKVTMYDPIKHMNKLATNNHFMKSFNLKNSITGTTSVQPTLTGIPLRLNLNKYASTE